MNGNKKDMEAYRISREITAGKTARAYLLAIDDNTGNINLSIIPEEQRQDIGHDHFKHDRDKRLLARSFLYELLAAQYSVTDFTLDYTAYKKPFLRAAPGIHFSFSYAKDYVFVGISEGKKLGIDIEVINRNIPIAALAENIMCAEELARFRSCRDGSAEQYRFFFRLFNAKESIIKAFGTGLNYDVRKINTLSATRYTYMQQQFIYHGEGLWMGEYFLALCTEE